MVLSGGDVSGNSYLMSSEGQDAGSMLMKTAGSSVAEAAGSMWL